MDQVLKAQMVAQFYHGDQKHGGYPYEYHLEMVVKKVEDLYPESPKLKLLQQVAWLHDVVEDTDIDPQFLLEEFGAEVTNAVMVVSKIEGEDLYDYYDRVATNKLAFKVKVADTLSNLEQSCKESMTKRIFKYTNQIQELYGRK
ncbi:metal-dependent phosphohydrolase [Vibrio phage 184E37-3b]|nr:hypothetical protein MYOV056v2_p0070 [Vibrio phage 184E37.3a]QZI89984.1 hypothetical protein MYOV057v1_p0069 [Vibrio phage 184E37.1]